MTKDTKGAIKIHISKKNRQHNDQRYQRGNQNPYIEEEQRTQWPKIPKGQSESVYLKRTDNTMTKDTKDAIRIRTSKKNRQHNDQKKKHKRTKHRYKTKDRVTRTPLKTWSERRCSGRVSSSCFTSGTTLTPSIITRVELRTLTVVVIGIAYIDNIQSRPRWLLRGFKWFGFQIFWPWG